MISTSFISGTGLKKCMPATRPGCRSPAAIAVTDSDDVLDARIVCGRDDLFELAQQRALLGEILDDRLDDELRADAIAERVHGDDARAAGAPRRRRRACPWRPALAASRAIVVARLFRSAHPRVEQPHRVAGLRGDLRDAGAHRPAADDGNRGVARQCAGCRHRCPITSGEPRYRPLKRGARFSRNAATPSR